MLQYIALTLKGKNSLPEWGGMTYSVLICTEHTGYKVANARDEE